MDKLRRMDKEVCGGVRKLPGKIRKSDLSRGIVTGAGFTHFLIFTPNPGVMIQCDLRIFLLNG